MKTDFLLD